MFNLQRIDSFGQTYLYIQKFLRYDSWHDTMPLNHYVTVHGIHSSHTCAFHSWRWCCRLWFAKHQTNDENTTTVLYNLQIYWTSVQPRGYSF